MDMTWFEQMEARIPKGEVRTRFAPSPTGYMHVGNLRTALYTWLIARHNGGKFILRIEDTDQERLVEGAVDVIYRTMAECGLDHDEGPDVGGPVGPYVQTERRALYGKYADLLIEKGHAYRCFCEKQEETEGFEKAADPCRCLSREESDAKAAAGQPYVVRQKIPGEGSTTFHDEIFGDITVENSTLDDQVLIKRDGLPTYNFANVIDDHLMHITHVVRGCEYLTSTPKYNMLYDAFGWEKPIYVHLPLIMGKNEDGSTNIRYDYFNLDDKQIFRDHEPLIAPAPACTDSAHSYYKEKKLSFAKTEDVYRRALQAAKKEKPLTFHWKGGYLTRAVLDELLAQIAKAGTERQKMPCISLNWPQAVLHVEYVANPQQATIVMEQANEGEETDV